MKVLVAAGGTGGHFYPGLTVAKALQADGVDVHFLVRHADMVLPLLEREKIPYSTIYSAGFKRRFSVQNILTLFKLIIGFFQSIVIFLKVRPTVLLAMGGYLSFPPALAAKLFGVPIILHEQNVVPGLANRMLSGLASKILAGFEESAAFFKKSVLATGNPVRSELLALPPRDMALRHWGFEPAHVTLLVFGGSLGAHRVNELTVEAIGLIAPQLTGFQVLHFTGTADEAWVRSAYEKKNIRAHVEAYCHEMPLAYAAANLVVCRAGASTLCELLVTKKPSLLIPYPHASENHQVKNAMVLKNRGVAEMAEEGSLRGDSLAAILFELLQNDGKRKTMAAAFETFSILHATAAVAIKKEVMSYGRGSAAK